MSDDDLDNVPDMPITRRWLSQAEWTVPKAKQLRPRRSTKQEQIRTFLIDKRAGVDFDVIQQGVQMTRDGLRIALWRLSRLGGCHCMPPRGVNALWYPGARP